MNVTTAKLPSAPVRTASNFSPVITGGKGVADKFIPSGDTLKKGAFGAVYMGIPFIAGLAGGGQAVGLGCSALSAGAGVYAARGGSGMDKAKMALSGFFVAQAANSIGQVAANPTLGGAINLAIGALIIGTSGKYLLQASE